MLLGGCSCVPRCDVRGVRAESLVLTVQYSFFAGMGSVRDMGRALELRDRPGRTRPARGDPQRVPPGGVLQLHPGDARAVVASVIHRAATGRLGAAARTVLFLPQVMPLVAAGIIWGWLLALPGLVNQFLTAIGLGDVTRAWLGDFDTALPAVGIIGIWSSSGSASSWLLTGMTKVDAGADESARIDGATAEELHRSRIPSLRYEIGVCLDRHDHRRPRGVRHRLRLDRGWAGQVDHGAGIQIYYTAFLERQVGLASALAVALTVLVLVIILPLQRLTRGGDR